MIDVELTPEQVRALEADGWRCTEHGEWIDPAGGARRTAAHAWELYQRDRRAVSGAPAGR